MPRQRSSIRGWRPCPRSPQCLGEPPLEISTASPETLAASYPCSCSGHLPPESSDALPPTPVPSGRGTSWRTSSSRRVPYRAENQAQTTSLRQNSRDLGPPGRRSASSYHRRCRTTPPSYPVPYTSCAASIFSLPCLCCSGSSAGAPPEPALSDHRNCSSLQCRRGSTTARGHGPCSCCRILR